MCTCSLFFRLCFLGVGGCHHKQGSHSPALVNQQGKEGKSHLKFISQSTVEYADVGVLNISKTHFP